MRNYIAITAIAVLLAAYFVFMGWQIVEVSRGEDLGEQRIYNIVKE